MDGHLTPEEEASCDEVRSRAPAPLAGPNTPSAPTECPANQVSCSP
jgi:hypothetical protein